MLANQLARLSVISKARSKETQPRRRRETKKRHQKDRHTRRHTEKWWSGVNSNEMFTRIIHRWKETKKKPRSSRYIHYQEAGRYDTPSPTAQIWTRSLIKRHMSMSTTTNISVAKHIQALIDAPSFIFTPKPSLSISVTCYSAILQYSVEHIR